MIINYNYTIPVRIIENGKSIETNGCIAKFGSKVIDGAGEYGFRQELSDLRQEIADLGGKNLEITEIYPINSQKQEYDKEIAEFQANQSCGHD